MRKQLGVFVAALLYYSGLVGLSRQLGQRAGKRLIILNYHHASEGELARHMLYLRRNYRMMHLEEALEELYRPDDGKARDSRTPLVLTFDDGYRDNYTHAYALARKLQVPITIFLVPGYLDSDQPFWWLEAVRLVNLATVDEVVVEEKKYHLHNPEERAALIQVIDTALRHVPTVAQRDSSLATFHQALGVTPVALALDDRDRILSWDEVLEMQESGWVSFGGHTMNHPILGYLTDPEEVRNEVIECRRVLEQHLGRPVRSFAYPVGGKEHIGSHAAQAVKDAGFSWAVTTTRGVDTPESDPYLLGRVLGDVKRHWLVMAAETSGIWHLLRAPLRAIRG